MRRVYAATAIVLCVAAAVAIAIVLTIDSDETAAKIGTTAFACLVFGVTAAAGTSAAERRSAWWLGWVCAAVSAAGFVITAVIIWSADGTDSEGIWKAFGSLAVAAIALAQISLLARRRDVESRRLAHVATAAQIAALLLAALLIRAILDETDDETYYRWVGVAWAIWLLSTSLVPLSRRLVRAS